MDMMKKEEDLRVRTLGQVSKEFGVSVYMLRKICDRGLIYGIRRKRNGYRVVTNEQVDRLLILVKLIECGVTWRDLKKFTRMERAGNRTANERKAMLSTRKRQLWRELDDIRLKIDFLEREEELLNQVIQDEMGGKPEHSA